MSFSNPQRFWLALIFLGVVARVYEVLWLSNPLDVLTSDPYRHWENGLKFLDPGLFGASNPILYQLYLFVVQKITQENRIAIGVVTAILSILVPVSWGLVASRVFSSQTTALCFTAIISLMPSLSLNYCFFMTETLLLPLLGFSVYLTLVAISRRGAKLAVLAVFAWELTLLTRSVILPVMLLSIFLVFRALPRGMRLAPALSSLIISVLIFTASARHSYKYFETYSPLGHDGKFALIYFLSDKLTYQINYRNELSYWFGSPTFGLPTFYPFSNWITSRQEGMFSFSFSPEEHGKDIDRVISGLFQENFWKIPRLVGENVLFLLFSYSWPESGTENFFRLSALWSRWIWAPLIVFSFFSSISLIRRGDRSFVPIFTAVFILALFGAQLALMEGRYRKPLEPVVILATLYAIEKRRSIRNLS